MKLLRVLRMLDDLAEVFVFDYVLATRMRRRGIAGATSIALLVAYASSGFWMAPAPSPELPRHTPPALAQLAVQPLPHLDVELAANVVRERRIDPARAEEVFAMLSRNAPELDYIASAANAAPETFENLCRALGQSRASGLTTLLLARGVWLREAGMHTGSVMDWILALKISGTFTRTATTSCSTTSCSTTSCRGDHDFSAHAVGSVLENNAVRLLCEHHRQHGLSLSELAQIRQVLATRARLTDAIALKFVGELEELRGMLARWARTNELPYSHRGLRFYLPVVASSRAAVAQAIDERVTSAMVDLASATAACQPLPERPSVKISRLAGWSFYLVPGAGWTERIETLVSNDAAADVAARLILAWRPHALEDYFTECRAYEQEVDALRQLCDDSL